MKSESIIAWLGRERFEALPQEAREKALEQVLSGPTAAPNEPTAAIWVLQKCGIKPTNQDLERWSQAVAPKSSRKSR